MEKSPLKFLDGAYEFFINKLFFIFRPFLRTLCSESEVKHLPRHTQSKSRTAPTLQLLITYPLSQSPSSKFHIEIRFNKNNLINWYSFIYIQIEVSLSIKFAVKADRTTILDFSYKRVLMKRTSYWIKKQWTRLKKKSDLRFE